MVLIFVTLMSLLLNTPSISLAENKTKDELLQELENIKNSQDDFMGAVTNYQGKSKNALTSLAETREQVLKNKAEIENLAESIEQAEEELAKNKKARMSLLRNFYIATTGKWPFLELLQAESFGDLIRRQIYMKNAQEKMVAEIKKSVAEARLLEEGKQVATVKREIMLSQIDILHNQLASFKKSIRENEAKIRDLEKNKKEVEQQILALDPPKVPLNTDGNSALILRLNEVDFAKQNYLTIEGAGTPHGIGMSQYGAKAMAEAGNDFEKILTHYYQGTKIGQINTDAIKMRVKLSASASGGAIIVSGGKALGHEGIIESGSAISARSGLHLEAIDVSTRFIVTYKFNKFNSFRGAIDIVGSAGNFTTVNTLPIEDYLRGVISGEMSSSWPKEALKAQAVAARNYAYKNLKPNASYDICDTPTCQVYHGASYEFVSTDLAIRETAGKMLYYGSEIITAYYFSTSGGWTENNENVWGGAPRPYLRGVASPGENSPYNHWTVKTLDKTTVERYLNADSDTAIGDLQKIEIIKRGVSGLVMAVKITGSAGVKLVTGQNFKYVININLPDNEPSYIKSGLFGVR